MYVYAKMMGGIIRTQYTYIHTRMMHTYSKFEAADTIFGTHTHTHT
jgi:hypothetical protein